MVLSGFLLGRNFLNELFYCDEVFYIVSVSMLDAA